MADEHFDGEQVPRERLVLSAGPMLRWTRHGHAPGEPQARWLTSDVTADAQARLFERVELDAALTLRDVFLLVGDNRVLRAVLHRQWVDDLMARAAPALARPRRPAAGYDPRGIEFLELFRALDGQGARNAVSGFGRLHFRGIGFELRDDLKIEGDLLGARGTRINWGPGWAALDDLMDLPLRLAQDVVVVEDDAAHDDCGREVNRFGGDATLGEVLHGVFHALSFFGGEAELAELLEDLAFDDDDDAPGGVDVQALLRRIAHQAAPRHTGEGPA